jgi:hypothetical protein
VIDVPVRAKANVPLVSKPPAGSAVKRSGAPDNVKPVAPANSPDPIEAAPPNPPDDKVSTGSPALVQNWMIPVCGPEKFTLEFEALAFAELNSIPKTRTTELRMIFRIPYPPNKT